MCVRTVTAETIFLVIINGYVEFNPTVRGVAIFTVNTPYVLFSLAGCDQSDHQNQSSRWWFLLPGNLPIYNYNPINEERSLSEDLCHNRGCAPV